MTQAMLPIVFALGIGFRHAFEADHLIAISNIVTQRRRTSSAMRDGIFWGLGHTSTILFIGILIIVGKWIIAERWFAYMEGVVGLALIALGGFRLFQILTDAPAPQGHGHGLAYGVGLVHGLAGSGAVVLLAMMEVQGSVSELLYLISFGAGSMIGMLLAAGLISAPLSKQFLSSETFQKFASGLTGLLCVGYGLHLVLTSFF